MEPLVVSKKDMVKGLFVFCKKCKQVIESGKCGSTGKRLSSCEFTDQHAFRAIVAVPGTNGAKRKSKVFNTRDVQEAIKMKLDFDKEMSMTGYQPTSVHVIPGVISSTNSPLLIDCMTMYIGYLNNENVQAHQVKQRSKIHIEERKRYFKYFCLCLKENGIDHTIFRMDQVNEHIVGMIHDYALNTLKYQNRTYNKLIGAYRQFTDWLIKKKNFNLINPFIEVTRRKQIVKVVTAEKSDFEALLLAVSPENGFMMFTKTEVRNIYRPWLKHAFRLALATGLRREEFMTLKFANIVADAAGTPLGIEQDNFKVNRSEGTTTEQDKQIKFTPLTGELMDLLIELDYERYKGTDHYLISPNDEVSRKTMIDVVSRAFSHYWSQTGRPGELKLKNMRKTHITSLIDHFGEKANVISDHEGIEVIKKHYLNKRQLAKASENFSVFK